jgi:hypothetical protein
MPVTAQLPAKAPVGVDSRRFHHRCAQPKTIPANSKIYFEKRSTSSIPFTALFSAGSSSIRPHNLVRFLTAEQLESAFANICLCWRTLKAIEPFPCLSGLSITAISARYNGIVQLLAESPSINDDCHIPITVTAEGWWSCRGKRQRSKPEGNGLTFGANREGNLIRDDD